jgi:RING-box protein 1
MADVDMPDAPTSAPVTKKKGGADGEAKEGKKRFEVKKVHTPPRSG